MKKLEIKPGCHIGRLTIIKEVEPHVTPGGHKLRKVLCECSCKNRTKVEVQLNNLRSGATTSCGCIQKEKVTTHGLFNHPLYKVCNDMKKRCSNKKDKYYGGRGITVCDEWLNDFKAFYDWCMSNGWKQGLEIDRINSDKGYSPDNCRFVTSSENNANRRPYGKIKYKGVSLSENGKKYRASVTVDGKTIYIGLYETAIEAAKAYDEYIINNNLNRQLNFPVNTLVG